MDVAYMKNMFYVADEENNRVYKFDLTFTKVKAFGSFGGGTNSFRCPIGLCFIKKYLYVCDSLNKRIQIFDVDFNFVATRNLDYNPFLIRTSYSSIVVSCSKGLYFYDLETRIIKKYHSDAKGCMSQIGSIFYVVRVIHRLYKTTFCFDADGNFIEEISMNRFGSLINGNKDGSLFCVNNILYMVSYESDKIVGM
jgi:hypothetical protein